MYLSKIHNNKIQLYKSFILDRPNDRRGADEVKRRRINDADESSPFVTPPHSPESPGTGGDGGKEGLKIKIKIQPNPQAPPPRVGLLPFEPLLELRDSLRNYTHNSSEWSEGMLAGLRTQLEGAKATISYLAQEVSQHSQVLEAWKPLPEVDKRRIADSTEKKSKKRRMHDDFKLTNGRTPVFKPTWVPYSRPYFNENDSSYSSCSSPEEAEVDVDGDEGVDVDVEALDGEDSQNADAEEAAKEEEYTPIKVKRRGGGAGSRNRMAQMIIQRHQGKPSSVVRRQKYKNLANSNPTAPPRRIKSDIPPTASPTDYDAGVAGAVAGSGVGSSDDEDEETAPVPLGPSAFWTAMEPYLRAPNEQDLAYITPKPPRADDPIFTIPPLGVHYLQVWANDDGMGSPPQRHSARVGQGRESMQVLGGSLQDYYQAGSGGGSGGGSGSGGGGGSGGAPAAAHNINNPSSSSAQVAAFDDEEAPDPIMGDITQRILQSLIDEHIIMNRPPSPFPDEHQPPPTTSASSMSIVTATAPDENSKDPTSSSSVPAIPVNNYSRAQMIALEDRIRLELRAIGLLDDEEIDPFEREDDEVCAELRLNQSLLREQIQTNNDRRLKLIPLVKAKMREHEEARKQKFTNLAIEKNYQKLIQKKKKRGGRRAPPLLVGV